MQNKAKNINSNAVFNMLKSALSIIYPLISFPYISRVLMAENVGKINFGSSVISYFSLFASLGVSTYAIRECARVRDNKDFLDRVSSEIFSINLASTLLSYIMLFLVLMFARPLANYRLLICIQSATILFTTLGADWINTAMEDFRFIAIRTIAMQIVSLVLMFTFVRKPEHYIIYAITTVVASSGASIANILYRKKYCRMSFTIRMNARKHLPSIFMLFSLTLSQIIYVNSDMTILGLIQGDFQVGLYSTSVKIYTLINTMIASIALVVMPQLSAGFAKRDYDEINKLLKYALNFIIVLGIPCFCGIEIIAPHIICFFAGEEYSGAALSLRILGVSLMFSLVGGWIGNASLIPAGREKVCLKASIACALVNVILNLLLIPKWGLNAAALTTAISELTGVMIMAPQIDKRIKITGMREMLKAPIIGGLGIILIGLAVQSAFLEAWKVTLLTVPTSVIWYVFIMVIMNNQFFLEFIGPIINKIKGGQDK